MRIVLDQSTYVMPCRTFASIYVCAQFAHMRRVLHSAGCQHKVGRGLEIFIPFQQGWFPARLDQIDGTWLLVKYIDCNGKNFEKWLEVDSQQLRSTYWGRIVRGVGCVRSVPPANPDRIVVACVCI